MFSVCRDVKFRKHPWRESAIRCCAWGGPLQRAPEKSEAPDEESRDHCQGIEGGARQRWRANSPGDSYLQFVEAELERRLKDLSPGIDVRTCEDFREFEVACCPVCHKDYPDEQNLVELETGRAAWVCCAVERALTLHDDEDGRPAPSCK